MRVNAVARGVIGATAIVLTLVVVPVGTAAQRYVDTEPAAEYQAKDFVLEWLSNPDVEEKYGMMSDAIWSYAELGMQEFRSAKVLTDDLEQNGFQVERGVSGMPTAFVATWGSGRPVVGLMAEYDALPGLSQQGDVPHQAPLVPGAPGHGCGHNQQGPAVIPAALALKAAMEEFGIGGTIKVFGGPAEETLISRVYMARDHLFDDLDVVLSNHGGTELGTRYGVSGDAIFSTVFTFRGETAHAAGSPWTARSAQDAVEIMNVAANYLREHLFYTYRMHYVVIEAGEAPNVVPDYARVWYFTRNTDDRVEEMHEKVINCARAAALATGTEMSYRVLSAAHQSRAPKSLAVLAQRNIELVGIPEWTEEEQAFAKEMQRELGKEETGLPTEVSRLRYWDSTTTFTGGGSSDIADLQMQTANVTVSIPGDVPGDIGHHWSRTAGNFGSATHKGIIANAKVLAATLLDLLTIPEELRLVRDEFAQQAAEHPYRTFLPDGAEPPIDLNKELMEKWRPLMEPFYLPFPGMEIVR
jgi:aminobenzoyl-glutamate utilization protein B